MIASGIGLVAQWLSRLHRMWEDAGSNPAGPIPPLAWQRPVASECHTGVQAELATQY